MHIHEGERRAERFKAGLKIQKISVYTHNMHMLSCERGNNYGYMQIVEIIEQKADAPDWLQDHPHIGDKKNRNEEKNAIFLPVNELSFMPNVNGCGLLNFRKDRVLTKEGMSRGKWDLPEFFKEVQISHYPDPWRDNYFQSAAIGQEFVLNANPQIMGWAKQIIK